MSIHKKIETENLAKAFESVMHTVAHGEAYRQVSEVLTTVNAHAQRIIALETTDEVLTKLDLDTNTGLNTILNSAPHPSSAGWGASL